MKKIISAVLLLVTLLTSSVFAKTSCLQEADLWTETFYTEQVRLYPKNTAYYANWSTYEGSYTNKGIDAAIGVKNAKTIYEIYGEECEDLHFFDIESTKSFETFIADDMQTNIKVTDLKEWNGFLFVCVYGQKGTTQQKSYTDYNGVSKTYTEAVRNQSGYDSYLYIFDISKNENYGKARVAKISKADINAAAAWDIIEFVDVTDDYIILTIKNGYNDSSTKRGLIVLANPIERGKTVTLTNSVKAKDIHQTNNSREWVNGYQSTVIGNTYIMWCRKTTDMAEGNQASQRVFYLTDITDGAVGTTESFYTTNTYGNALDDILSCPVEGGWQAVSSPKIEAISNKDNKFYFLVSYISGGINNIAVYKTDWSNPYEPKLENYTSYEFNGADLSKGKNLYKYEDKVYFSYDNGIDVLDSSLNYLGTIPYSDMFSQTPGGGIQFFVVDNYMYAWFGISPTMYDIKAELTDNNTAVLNAVVGQTAKQKPLNTIVFYGDKVYIPSFEQSPAMYKPNVVKVDYSKAVPIRLEIVEPPKEMTLPYTIKGSGYNLDHVIVNDNGEEKIIKATSGEDGIVKWEYKVTDVGEHNITFTGALGTDYVIEGTAETVNFTASKENTDNLTAEYTEGDTMLTVQIVNPDKIKGMYITAVYVNEEMTDIVTGDLSDATAKSVSIPADKNYSAKTFFVNSIGQMQMIKNSVSK